MFNIGNQVVVKPENKQGFIYSVLDECRYMVGIKENESLRMQILTEDQFELKPCEFGKDGLCNYITDCSPAGQFACIECELHRDILD